MTSSNSVTFPSNFSYIRDNAAAFLPLNNVLFNYFTTANGELSLTTPISKCKCFNWVAVALEAPTSGSLTFNYYDTKDSLLFVETIPLDPIPPTINSYRRNIKSKYIQVVLSLDNPSAGNLGLFVTLRKQYV